MAGHRESLNTRLKENAVVTDTSNELSCVESSEKYGSENYTGSNTINSYTRHDLLNLRYVQLSMNYPQCALRPELQALSIWTCRLRYELQCLGLWKISNAGNCNGNCQSHACGGQPTPASNSQVGSNYSQVCHKNNEQSQPAQLLQTRSSPTLTNKKPLRSREPFLNYKRCVNTESTRAMSPIGSMEGSFQQNINYAKPPIIDHRSISSSHLMPAFAKRRIGHANALQSQSDSGPQDCSSHGQIAEHLSNDDGYSESSTHFETSIECNKVPGKVTNHQSDRNLHDGSVHSQLDKTDLSIDNQPGWINIANKIDSEFSPPNKVNNTASTNKKLIYERRIGSGRLCVAREVNWNARTGNNKQNDKELSSTLNNTGEKYRNISSVEVDKIKNRNSSIGRHSDQRTQERRIFDRRISSGSENLNSGSRSRTKTYTTISPGEERNNFDSNYHQQIPHFTGQRSMSFRRRESSDTKDHHQNFRDLRNPKETVIFRDKRESRKDNHYIHSHHKNHKEEPEWFSEGPSSQHDTIELRGFEETDSQKQPEELSKIENESSLNTLHSYNISINLNSRANDNINISSELLNNSNSTKIAPDNDVEKNDACGCRNVMEIMSNKEITDDNEKKPDLQQSGIKLQEFEVSNEQHSNDTELFFDKLLSDKIEPSSGNNDGGGTSRFSRWFFSGPNNDLISNDEYSHKTRKEESKQIKTDLNESDFNSFMSFLKCNNFASPELTKELPPNVSALSVAELEARMRAMNSCKVESTQSSDRDINLQKSWDYRSEREYDVSPVSTEKNREEVDIFRKLLEDLRKPEADIAMGSYVSPNVQGQNQLGLHNRTISPLQPFNSLPQSNNVQQEFIWKRMHQQQQIAQHHQRFGDSVAYFSSFNHLNHSSVSQISPHQISGHFQLMSVSYHNYLHNNMPITLDSKKRIDVQHLIQSVHRDELSCSFLEKELKNPHIPPYTKEIISTALKETFYNLASSGGQNSPVSNEIKSNNNTYCAPNNIIQYTKAQPEPVMHEDPLLQTAFLKTRQDLRQQKFLRRLEMQKQYELEISLARQQLFSTNSTISQQGHHQSSRHICSPTPLAFTPTSVLRKMTADKETLSNSTQAATNSFSLQQIKPVIQQHHI